MEEEVGGVTLGDLKRWPLSVRVMIGVAVVLLFVIYAFYPAYPMTTGRSLTGWTWVACNSYNGFLHGRFVPLVFPWMIWWAWKGRQEEVVKPSCWGLVWVGFALLLFWASMRAIQPRWALVGAPFLVIGLTQYLFGGRITKAVIFPAFFLWFAIPVPGLEGWIDAQMRPVMIRMTHQTAHFLGFDVIDENGGMRFATF